MAKFCNDKINCRRAQILEVFDEGFEREACFESKIDAACDNCIAFKSNAFVARDIRKEALICKGLKEIGAVDLTLLQLSKILRGTNCGKSGLTDQSSLTMHGQMKSYALDMIEEMICQLVFMQYLKEEAIGIQYYDKIIKKSQIRFNCYIKLDKKATLLLTLKGSEAIELYVPRDETYNK